MSLPDFLKYVSWYFTCKIPRAQAGVGLTVHMTELRTEYYVIMISDIMNPVTYSYIVKFIIDHTTSQ